jgi:predicted CopG family antitoxin
MISYGKVIKVSDEVYNTLHDLKFKLKKDTFGEVIEELIKGYNEKVSA